MVGRSASTGGRCGGGVCRLSARLACRDFVPERRTCRPDASLTPINYALPYGFAADRDCTDGRRSVCGLETAGQVQLSIG